MTFCCNLFYPFYLYFFFQIFTNMVLMQFVISLYSMPYIVQSFAVTRAQSFVAIEDNFLIFLSFIFVIIYQTVFTLL